MIVGVLGVNVDTEFRLEVRWPIRAAAHEVTTCALTQMSPLDAQRGHLVLGQPEQVGHVLTL